MIDEHAPPDRIRVDEQRHAIVQFGSLGRGTRCPNLQTMRANRGRKERELRLEDIYIRTPAVFCRRGGGRLGLVFEDGPAPPGVRAGMNGVAMSVKPATG